MPDSSRPRTAPLFSRPSARERRWLTEALRTETVGGMVLLAAALVALIWANTPLSDSYEAVRSFHFGIPALGLDLSVEHWASDGVLTLFFFVAGIELKRELVTGELRNPAAAALPVVAALSGMAVPALFYLATNLAGGGRLSGWAVPMATDIAFALGVLAVIGTHLPAGIRAFLLTLAIVDDLGAIVVIALFFTSTLNWAALAGALAGLVLFRVLHVNLRVRGWYVYVPLALVIWGLMYNSGVHATISGVAMGMLLSCRPRGGARTSGSTGTPGAAEAGESSQTPDAGGTSVADDEPASPAEEIEHRLRPLSAGFAVPVFALFAAGVAISGPALADVFRDPEPLGVVLGLFLGKLVGVFGGTYLAARFTRARLDPALSWSDVFGISMLAGIGFTVSLLIAELAFTQDAVTEHVKAAVLIGSLLAAIAACVLLKLRDAKYRALWEEETRDEDKDTVPDIDQPEDPVRRPAEAARRAAERAREEAERAREEAEAHGSAEQRGRRDGRPGGGNSEQD
ncbi:Na+/H+ antiporter NhaA [Streptomyces ovatisporus]|uniref:Na(+)/H(+) antiporter NhaA n=1 Tax=Streptomyces ovatisporus TaxID=1128682 RepID=A0ABV9A390_9ACTN